MRQMPLRSQSAAAQLREAAVLGGHTQATYADQPAVPPKHDCVQKAYCIVLLLLLALTDGAGEA